MKFAAVCKAWGQVSLYFVLGTALFGADAPVPFDIARDVPYVKRGDVELKANIYSPQGAGPFPGVLMVHGGAWAGGDKSHMDRVSRLLVAHDYTVVAINYRLAPKHPFPAQIEDCKTAVRWMRVNATQYKIDPTHIAGYGYSAGGHLVALLGMTDATCGLEGPDATPDAPDTRLQCVVAGGAPCDFRLLPENNKSLAFWLGGSRAEKPDLYELASPARFVSKDDPPAFFFHGELDWLVPVASPQFMVAQLKATGVTATLLTLPDAGHIAAFLDTAPALEAIKFLDAQLKPAAKE